MLTINLPDGALAAARLFAGKPDAILFDAKACCIVATDRMQCIIIPVAAGGDLESVLLPYGVNGASLTVEGGFVFTEDGGMSECGNVDDFPDWRKLYDQQRPDSQEWHYNLRLLERVILAHELLGGAPNDVIPVRTNSIMGVALLGDDSAAQVLWAALKPFPVKRYDLSN